MRTAPIGVLLGPVRAQSKFGSLEESAITHFDPRCQLACAALNEGIAYAMETGEPAVPAMMVHYMRNSMDAAALWLGDGSDVSAQIDDAVADLHRDFEAAARPDPELYGPELHIQDQQGFVRVAFRLALWELLHAPSFEAALIDVVNRGGDADTNAAITGALLGAVHSVWAIPRLWRKAVLKARGGNRELRTTYHPRVFVEGLEKVYGRRMWTGMTGRPLT